MIKSTDVLSFIINCINGFNDLLKNAAYGESFVYLDDTFYVFGV